MDVKEFKLRALHGLIRPRYFYIPVKTEEEETISSIIIVIEDEEGNPAYVTGCSISINSYTWPYDGSWNESHTQYTTLYTDSSDTYIFDDDFRWIIPVTDKDNYRVPTPDFSLTGKAPTIDGGGVDTSSIYSYRASFTFTSPKNRIKIDNLRPGRYNLDVTLAPGWYTKTYAPEHWDDIYTNGEPWMPINYQNDYFTLQITKSGQLTGVGEWYHSPEIRPPYTDYIDFFKIKKPFENNVYPIVTKRRTRLRFVLTEIEIPGFSDLQQKKKHASTVNEDLYYYTGTWALTIGYGVNYGYTTTTVNRTLGFKVYEDGEYAGLFYPDYITVYATNKEIDDVQILQRPLYNLQDYYYTNTVKSSTYYRVPPISMPLVDVVENEDYSNSVHYDITADIYEAYAYGPYNENTQDICIYPDNSRLPNRPYHVYDRWHDDLYNYMSSGGHDVKVIFSSRGTEQVHKITDITRVQGRGASIQSNYKRYNDCTYREVSFTNPKTLPNGYTTYDISCGGEASIHYKEYDNTDTTRFGSKDTYKRYKWPGHFPTYDEMIALNPSLVPDDANKGYLDFYYFNGMTVDQFRDFTNRLQYDYDALITVETDLRD